MRRAYLDRLTHDPGGLGWHASCHAQVKAQGGGWSLVKYWRGGNCKVGDRVVVLIDVSDHSALAGLEPLGVFAETKAGLRREMLRQGRADEVRRLIDGDPD